MKRFNKKSIIIFACLIIVITATVTTTVAVLIDESTVWRNTFYPNDINTEIEETLSGSVKSNVKIKNTGTTDAFIRANIVVSWKNEAGKVYGTAPTEGIDYTISIDLTNGWKQATDGFYYYTDAVKPNTSTGVLVTSCSPVAGKAPNGYKLTVEILGSGVQSKPARVAITEWSSGVASVNGDKLTVK